MLVPVRFWVKVGFQLPDSHWFPSIERCTYIGEQVLAAPSWGSPVVPDLVFCFYELMFCACATMIVVGGSFERGRIMSLL